MRISGAERGLGVLGYLPILCFVAVKAKKDSIFVQFHARQGSVLFLLWAAIALLCLILLFVVGGSTVGQTVVIGAFFLATFLYMVMAFAGIVKVLLGERYRMPVVADVALMLRL